MHMAVFQHSYRLRWWARFGPWPMVCRPLLEGRILRGEKRMKGKKEYWDVGARDVEDFDSVLGESHAEGLR